MEKLSEKEKKKAKEIYDILDGKGVLDDLIKILAKGNPIQEKMNEITEELRKVVDISHEVSMKGFDNDNIEILNKIYDMLKELNTKLLEMLED